MMIVFRGKRKIRVMHDDWAHESERFIAVDDNRFEPSEDGQSYGTPIGRGATQGEAIAALEDELEDA